MITLTSRLTSARNISAGFTGSVVLQQNSTGVSGISPLIYSSGVLTLDCLNLIQHTSISGFSTCTALAIRAYFENGTLPAPGTVCQPDTQIFQSPGNSSADGGVTVNLRSLDIQRNGESPLQDAARAISRSDYLARNSLLRKMRLLTRGKRV